MKFDIKDMINLNNQNTDVPTIVDVPLDLLVPYHNHQFTLYSGERLADMVQSVKQNGILTPIIVQPFADEGKYEILAGHNRCNAAKEAGLTTIPAVVKSGLTEQEAEMYVIETNVLQRGFGDLKISEQAAVIAARHSKMFDKQKQREISEELRSLGNGEAESKSKLAETGEEYGLSKNTVARLIRIDKLLKTYGKFAASIDLKILSVRAAVELSYITSKEALSEIFKYYIKPVTVDDALLIDIVKINLDTAEELRSVFENFDGKKEEAIEILVDLNSANKNTSKPIKPIKISFQPDIFQKYFSKDTSPDEIADTIDKALEMYFKNKS